MGQAVLINLLSSLAAFVLGLGAREAVRRWTDVRPTRKVWRIDRNAGVSIVTSKGPERSGNDLKVTWEADAHAATAVAHYLGHRLGISLTRAAFVTNFPAPRDMENNLVVIGGPAMNGLYEDMARRIDIPYTFELTPGHPAIIRRSDEHAFAPVVEDGRIIEDYGVITLTGNPFRQGSRLVMLAGCGEAGTLAAAQLLTSSGVRDVAKIMRSTDFTSIVIRVELFHGYMTEPRIVDRYV
jgi:hypothetical protein